MTTKPIQLYSLATPNGIKISFALELLQLPYDAHVIDIRKGDQFTDEFKRVNPNSKIPAIVDYDEKGEPLNIFESGAILLYLAEKTGKLLPKDPRGRYQTIQWLFWQMGGVGPMFGQFGHFFVYAKEKIPYAIERYETEVKRLLSVLDKQLEGHSFIVDNEITIADIAVAPWISAIDEHYHAVDRFQLESYKNVYPWLKRIQAYPEYQKAKTVTPFKRD